MSLRQYRLLDLGALLLIGIVCELIGCYLINAFLPWVVPIFVANFVVTYVAIMRWGAVGIFLSPIITFMCFIANTYIIPYRGSDAQFVPNIVTMLVANLAPLLLIVFKHKMNFNSFPRRFLTYSSIFLLLVILGTLLEIPYNKNVLLCFLRIFTDELMSFVLSVVILEVLFYQGVTKDIKQKIKQDKEELEYEKNFYEN